MYTRCCAWWGWRTLKADELMMANVRICIYDVVTEYLWYFIRDPYADSICKATPVKRKGLITRSVHAQCMCSALIDKRVIGLWRQRRNGHHYHQLRGVAFQVDICCWPYTAHAIRTNIFPFAASFVCSVRVYDGPWCTYTHYWLNCRRSAWRLHYTDWPCILHSHRKRYLYELEFCTAIMLL